MAIRIDAANPLHVPLDDIVAVQSPPRCEVLSERRGSVAFQALVRDGVIGPVLHPHVDRLIYHLRLLTGHLFKGGTARICNLCIHIISVVFSFAWMSIFRESN